MKNPTRQMTEIERAWLAGFIDGEGSIGVYRKKSASALHPHDFGVRLLVVNTNQPVMDYIKVLTGCGCSWVSKKGFKPQWRPVHRWACVGENARDIVRQILPYLKIKRAIADLILTMPVNSKQGRTAAQVIEQLGVFSAAKELNRRGVRSE